ncbi:unnamed protein product [Phytophthora fragariaefolia]|uniref:Unnamed protein product n=1 Tax=Phytophthora fragariaefolia TaxID=1490495 RepID=A0A9W6XEK8_9STRA|nr:unnamed protein product [Phytophthora fragariaefolia]
MNAVADALSRPPPEGLEDEEDKEPPLPDVTVAQQQVNTVDYHFVSPHLAPETKRAFQKEYEEDPAFKQQWFEGAQKEKFVKHNGLLFFKQKKGETVYRLCVPNVKELRTNVMIEFHDGKSSAHSGSRRTYLKAAQWYCWPTMDRDVREYVRTCETCARWKSSSQKKKGLLIPIPVPKECWEVVSMDFITGLPVSEGFDAILVAVDKLSKRAKYAPTYSTADAKDTAKVFFDAVVRHHGLPKVIISDRDSKFLSDVWKSLMKLMGIKLRTIEYAHSTLVNASTKFAPFELDTGRKVSNIVAAEMKDLLQSENDVTLAEFATNFAKERQEIVERARQNLKEAQARQKEYYDRKRRQVVFKEGGLVLLDTKNLPLKTVNQNTELKKAKLAAKKVGPFVIERMVNDNVAKLILPHTKKRLNPTFNVELLTHYLTNREDFRNRPIPKAVPLILDEDTGEELYIVEKLLKKRTRRRKRQWLVKWHGLPKHEATWESEAQIRHVSHGRQLRDEYRLRQREGNPGDMSCPPLAC